jgi:cytochrome c oxidase subunit 3
MAEQESYKPKAEAEVTKPEAHGEHPAFLAHHFETPEQQFSTGKLGMWVFLLTEILLFSGLFCAYAVYRANHPEIFEYAHQYLSKTLGAINTGVLITSSLTMAWAVRSAQLGQRRRLVVLLALTLLGGCGFLGIKYAEYRNKWEEGLLWARQYKPVEHAETAEPAEPAEPADGHATKEAAKHAQAPRHVGIFFSIYFVMTGLHGLHVIAGMGAIGWVLARSIRGDFSPLYFGPVDYVGLYWHLVDLVWIFLFPLLYLIH